MRASFGSLTVDTDARRLDRDGAELHLTPKAFDLLALLLEAAPKVVSKRDLHARLWRDSFVADATLVGLVKEVRRVLQQDLQRRETVETGQGVIGQDEIRRRARERLAEIALRDDVPPLHGDPVLRQLQLDQLGVVRVVLQQHETQGCGRTFLHNDAVEPFHP